MHAEVRTILVFLIGITLEGKLTCCLDYSVRFYLVILRASFLAVLHRSFRIKCLHRFGFSLVCSQIAIETCAIDGRETFWKGFSTN